MPHREETPRRPQGRPRTCWSDYVTWLAWERLGILPEELEEVSGEREVGVSLISGQKWMDGWILIFRAQ